MSYPTFRKDDVVDELHGRWSVSDCYRWLEDPDAEETKAFVAAQNELSGPFLRGSKYRHEVETRLEALWDHASFGCLKRHGRWLYYYHNSGLQDHSILYRTIDLEGTPEVVLDPNKWSEDGTISLTHASFSEDGSMLAVGQSSSGHDWVVVKFMNTESLQILPDELNRIKFSSFEWTHDNKGVFYSGYLEQDGKVDGTETTSNINQKLRYHKLGTDQSEDILCYDIPEHPKWLLSGEVSDCGRYVLLIVHESCEPKTLVSLCDLARIDYNITERLEFKSLVDKFEAKFDYIVNDESRFLFTTNKDAPMYKVVEVNVSDMNNLCWTELIPTQDQVLLNWAACAHRNQLIVCYQKDVADSLAIYNMDTGERLKDINFPLGSISGLFSKRNQSTIFIKFSSFLVPGINYSYDFSKGNDAELKVMQKTTVKGIVLEDMYLEQIFYESKDGTKIPMFIMYHKDTVIDGTAPCHLYGYGGFDISIKPSFSVRYIMYMKHFKYVYAVANIRGGGEYGKMWHDGGRLKCKQNCFDDFIAAAEYLINNKYSDPKKLAIEGGSNGGLLVAACMNQRPELFGVVIGHVGVLDMLRFHKFTIGHAWVSDFGDPDNSEDFEWIIKYSFILFIFFYIVYFMYSPLHNIRHNTSYPACLLLTADHDDRVVPLHTMKFVAQLQEIAGPHSKQPLMVRIDVKSGHGSGKPTSKRIEEACDILCFEQQVLGLEWFD